MSERIRGIDFGTSTSLAAERTDILDPVTISPLGKTTNWMPTVLALPIAEKYLLVRKLISLNGYSTMDLKNTDTKSNG